MTEFLVAGLGKTDELPMARDEPMSATAKLMTSQTSVESQPLTAEQVVEGRLLNAK